jgi:hypothetical protein
MTTPSPVEPQRPEEVSEQPPTGAVPSALPPDAPVPPQYAPVQYPPTTPPAGQERPKTIGVLALVFGSAALLFGLIPVAGIFIGGLFGTAALVLGIIGIIKSHKIMSIIGLVLTVVATILSFAITSAVADDVADDIEAGLESGAPEAASDAAADDAAEPEIAGVGETVTDGTFEFTVSGFEQGVAEVGTEFMNEQAQGEFVIVELVVKNTGSEASYFSDGDQLLFDVDGNEYSANSTAGLLLEDNDIWLTEINPGNQVEGKIVFDVPAGTELAKMELHESLFSGGVEVSLQ